MTLKIGLLFAGAMLAALPAAAQKAPGYGAFLYSSLCTEEESGDESEAEERLVLHGRRSGRKTEAADGLNGGPVIEIRPGGNDPGRRRRPAPGRWRAVRR